MQAKQTRSDILYMTTLDTGRCSHMYMYTTHIHTHTDIQYDIHIPVHANIHVYMCSLPVLLVIARTREAGPGTTGVSHCASSSGLAPCRRYAKLLRTSYSAHGNRRNSALEHLLVPQVADFRPHRSLKTQTAPSLFVDDRRRTTRMQSIMTVRPQVGITRLSSLILSSP